MCPATTLYLLLPFTIHCHVTGTKSVEAAPTRLCCSLSWLQRLHIRCLLKKHWRVLSIHVRLEVLAFLVSLRRPLTIHIGILLQGLLTLDLILVVAQPQGAVLVAMVEAVVPLLMTVLVMMLFLLVAAVVVVVVLLHIVLQAWLHGLQLPQLLVFIWNVGVLVFRSLLLLQLRVPLLLLLLLLFWMLLLLLLLLLLLYVALLLGSSP